MPLALHLDRTPLGYTFTLVDPATGCQVSAGRKPHPQAGDAIGSAIYRADKLGYEVDVTPHLDLADRDGAGLEFRGRKGAYIDGGTTNLCRRPSARADRPPHASPPRHPSWPPSTRLGRQPEEEAVAEAVTEELVRRIPAELHAASGKAFHSGRRAFSGNRDLYVLGLNPGGDPADRSETVAGNAEMVRSGDETWSALLDQSWGGHPPGHAPLQRQLRSLLSRLGLDPREVPFSDAIFARTRQASQIEDRERLMELCWPFHLAVIQGLRVRVVLCLYKPVAEFVRKKLGARPAPVHRVCEQSMSGRTYWRECYAAPGDLKVIQITRSTGIPWEDNAYALAANALGCARQR